MSFLKENPKVQEEQSKDNWLLRKDDRLRELYWIKSKTLKKVLFKRNRAQADFQTNKGLRNIILKSRQLGFTTEESIDSLDDILFTPNMDALIIAHEKQEAIRVFDTKIAYAWDNFPP